MVMVNLPAARRHHRSRVGYALGLFAFLVVATALALVVRHPAFSATQQLAEPVPAPEITVAGEDGRAASGEDARAAAGEDDGWSPTDPSQDEDDPEADAPPAGTGGGEGTLAERPTDPTDDLSRSLFYSGLLGLAISLAGLGLVGARRRQW
ncbi:MULTISPECIES: hypothetical protein [Micromonospora]|uniref:Gram-positive cocci surface proteins LPxTG domain-containing protein n=2 Tax=Micromonospora TaxID=1873 RepID=A0ABX9YBX4_MICCH|nr:MULTISPECIES: hypothetical protein [Micromonospora]MBQ1065123.1 hypothetical protein [Micromonospora sp. C41]MCT2281876.1 hypothetical protein [Micromonospora chalcea]NHO82685.1 hypothetical protein [Micromonospora sp. CMU55-4]RBQ13610.1 hypothetical protein DQE82_07860 [Micromonospora sp. LHW51205]RQW96907.1 hypothetical protein DLJ60_03760 [Micromonospora chalcea]